MKLPPSCFKCMADCVQCVAGAPATRPFDQVSMNDVFKIRRLLE
jgi:hypothetical protein